jgi:tRNA threonylcarbamoyladenosine biosynthesis protein TsaB
LTILSLDTSSAAGSAAIVRDGAIVIERAGDAARTHGQRLPRELIELLAAAHLRLDEIDGFAVATGPGSFTGLRIGIATIQGLALAHGKLVAPVSTFEALAVAGAPAPGDGPRPPLAVWIDAHRGEVFAVVYGADGRQLHEPSSMSPEATLDAWAAIFRQHPRVLFAGDGAIRYREILDQRLAAAAAIPSVLPTLAGAIGLIAAAKPARAVKPHAVVPLYVRRSDAELARDRRLEADGN